MDLELNGKDTDIHHTGIVCITDSEGNQVSGFRTWSDDECNGVIESFVGEDGEPVTPDSWIAGTCLENTPECAESQEWTYGIDNTGTIYNDVATYSFDLSDGSTLDFAQDGSSTSWSPQLIEWAANVQQAADDAGLSWFVEPRFVTETNLTNGGGGLAGAPSEALGQGLYDGGMRWRYLNIQICAGQPVPTRAYRKTSTTYGDGEFDLTSAGAFLGPITKFKKCHKCGNGADVWYVLDEVAGDGTYREATAGEVPNCAEPCGTLALADAPPDRDCEFIFDVACDNNNSNNTDDFTNTITRRATICNGQQISLNYFEQDPDDASALIDYELQGDFVDCATGELIPVPQGDILINCTGDKVAEEHDIKVQIQGSKNPLPVFIAEKCTDDVSLDTEVLCNEDTDVWEYHVTTVTNGVASNLTITPTTVACDEEQPDFETRTICVNGTEHYQVLQIDEDGAETVLSEVDSTLECPDSEVSCVESQEWTYGIDNTGTTTDEDAVITITLSDGSSFDIQQTNQGAVSQWTPQMGEWGDNIQSAADAAGLAWFVETRCILSSGGLDGCGGFSGPPSVPISEGLWAGGISARYVNIQICAGQPVPVGAVYNSATRTDYTLTTAGAVKGPLQKFFVCRSCGNEPVWYLSDGVTPASSGQIPNCYEPCGTITLADAPPDRECDFIFDVACDNNNSVNTVNFTNTITRRSTVCNGQQIGLDYFEQDPDDTSSLIEYELVGDFVDCATGEPVDVPPQPCETYDLEKFWQLSGVSQGLRNREWTTDLPILGMEDVDATIDFVDTFDYSVAPDVDTVITSNVALLNDTDDTAVVLDYQLREGYIVVDTPVTVRWGASSEGALLVDLGLCGGDLKRVVAIASAVGLEYTNSVYLPTGIHYIRMHNVDNAGSNSSWVPQSSNNGIDFVADNDVLDDLSSTTQPSNECLTVKICETSGETYNFITDEVVDVSTLKTCPISCGAADCNRR